MVDRVRTAFGRAGADGIYGRTRADDLAVKAVREILRRNPALPPERIGDVVFAATAQVGDQGLTLGATWRSSPVSRMRCPGWRSTGCAPAR